MFMRKTSIQRGYALLLSLLLLPAAIIAQTASNVNFTHEGLNINARLVLPNGQAPHKVVVINPGTGSMDKDGTVQIPNSGNFQCLYPGLVNNTITTYKDISDALANAGYAVLTYDKVEYTHPNPGTITFEKLWLPIQSAVTYLKTRNDIDGQNIILLGHSEGSTIIPYIANRNSGISTLISLAGSRQPLDTLLAYQLVYIERKCGGDTNAAKIQAAGVLQYFDAIRQGNWNVSTPPALGVPASAWDKYLKMADSVSINYNLAQKHTLFVGLGDDFNVPPATELSRFKQEITVTNDFYEIPGMNHFVTTATNPKVSATVTDTIITWLKGKVPPTSVTNTPSANNQVLWAFGNTQLRVWTKGTSNMQRIIITDITGRMVADRQLNSKDAQIDFAYPAGTYLMTVSDGNNRYATKMVKHN